MLPTFWDLSADHRVIAPDLPGFGDSAKPLRSYNASFYAKWLKGFFDAVNITKADIVGNSMGGRIAIEAALSFPEKVERLVLLAPSPAFIRRREFVKLVGVLRPELALIPLPMPRRQVMAGLKRLFARPSRMAPHRLDAAVDEFLRVFSTPKGRIAFFSAARQIYLEEPFGDEGFWNRLPTLQTPSLFVWGEKDRLVPPKFSRHVERALPNATSVILEDCGHVPQFELPERTNELVRSFIDVKD
jgi:pimeloyl-ACP methyl ester carboxylesterase